MADESDLPVVEAEDPGDSGADDGGDAFDGLPDLIDNLTTVNGLLDTMVTKLAAVEPRLDAVIAKLAQIDTGTAGGSTPDAGAGATPGSEGG